jgi:Transcription initiation factor IID, 31kD subunit
MSAYNFFPRFQGYTSDVFQDALVYAEHAGRQDIDLADVQLAVQGRVSHSFTAPPPREVSQFGQQRGQQLGKGRLIKFLL